MQLLPFRQPAVLLASIIAGAFLFFFTRHSGIGVSPDSVSYYTAALHILNNFSLTDFNDLPLVDFPAGYAVFLALVSLPFKGDVLSLAPIINIGLFIIALSVTGYIIRKFKNKSVLFEFMLLCVLACSPGLLEVYSMLWSETVFICLCLLFLVAIQKYLSTHTIGSLVWAAAIAAIAFVTRFAGITLLLTGGCLLLFDGGLTIRKKATHLVLFGIVSSSLTVINVIHNMLVSDSLAGVREVATRSVANNILEVSNTIAEWLPFIKGHEIIACLFFVTFFLMVLGRGIFHIFQQQYYPTIENTIDVFFIIYTSFIVAVASLSRFEDLSNRLMSPAYIPFFLISSSWIVAAFRNRVGVKKILLSICIILFYLSVHLHQYQENAAAWEGISEAGIPGYTEDSWKNSPTVAYLNKHRTELPPVLFSDAHDAVYFLTRLHAKPLPHREIEKEKSSLLKHPLFCVIWFNDGFNQDLVDIDFIKKHKMLLSKNILDDGVIYYFSDSITPPLK